MKTAKKFLKAKGLKDTLYNVKYNPNQNRGLPEKEWIKGGLSALLDEYADVKVKNFSINPSVIGSLPTDEEIKAALERGLKLADKDIQESAKECWMDGAKWLRDLILSRQ